MSTRLDRLLLILDTGSTPVTRKAAAKQLGGVQKLHPHELPNLLARVHAYLKSKTWDTRVAAAQAIEAIASNVPLWNPDGVKVKAEECEETSKEDKLLFEHFDISVVLEKGEKLLGSAGDEFDMEDDPMDNGMSKGAAVAFQRHALRKRLGLDLVGGLDMGLDNLLEDDDLLASKNPKLTKSMSTESAADIVASQIAAISSDGQLSSREKNRAKRLAKNLAKQRSRDQENRSFEEGSAPAEKRQRRVQSVLVEQPSEDKVLIDSVADNELDMDTLEEWPFAMFCCELCNELFSPSWEIRHGASSGLREIIKIHGSGAGKTKDTQVIRMTSVNTEWLEDMALRLLCVFALDRFGDFVSDEVVAPVHEVCAQTLGSVLHHMSCESVRKVLSVLVKLQEHIEWQVKHGGLLGLKYMLAVRKDMAEELLPQVLPWIKKGLQDGDDVRAVAAAALLPVSQMLHKTMPEQIPIVLQILWDTLLELDDLTASTNSIMSLLSSLVTIERNNVDPNVFASLVPRLYPFFKHTISSVRSSSLKTLQVLLSNSKGMGTTWLQTVFDLLVQHIFQRIVLDPVDELQKCTLQVWSTIITSSPSLLCSTLRFSSTWFQLLVQPSNVSFEPVIFNHNGEQISSGECCHIGSVNTLDLDGSAKETKLLKTRISMSRALAVLLTNVRQNNEEMYLTLISIIETLVSSTSALQRLCGAFVLYECGRISKSPPLPSSLITKLHALLSDNLVYEELLLLHQRLQADTQSLIFSFNEHNIDISTGITPGFFTLDSSVLIATTKYNEECNKLPAKLQKTVALKQQNLMATINEMKTEYLLWHMRVQSSFAATLIVYDQLTPTLNPIVRPIMDSVKRENNYQLQQRTAIVLSQLLLHCASRNPCPNTKIIKNLCSFVCSDANRTPPIHITESTVEPLNDGKNLPPCNTKVGILTLHQKQKKAIKAQASTKRGRFLRNNSEQHLIKDAMAVKEGEEIMRQIQCEGASVTLSTCSQEIGADLHQQLPSLWEAMFDQLRENSQRETQSDIDAMKRLITAMQLLEITAASLHSSIKPELIKSLCHLAACLIYPYTSVRHMAARCFGMLSTVITAETMEIVLKIVADLLKESDNIVGRQGAMETLTHIIDRLEMRILPYIVLLIVPILARMSDHQEDIRLVATNCFASLVQLMPLESGAENPVGMSTHLRERRETERKFLEQLLDEKKIDQFNIPIPIKCELRKYQQDGVNWLAFLKKYNLHGILCDDMGLGKTLQSICIMAGDHYNSMRKYKISGKEEMKPLPSLVVCPPTLTGHWCYEVQKFCKKEHLNALNYTGNPWERQRLQSQLANYNLVVTSYDIIRNDSEFFAARHWNYCILDEGHIIKNSKTKLSKKIKQLKSNHRVILSGTPIQNNVLELWSLFDFLMPGFLGTEREFTTKFGKPILQSKDAKSSSKEQEAGALAMEALHKQTLPFLLRRVKEDVLQDLPPKIIQDYYCELCPLQVRLYEDFSKSQAQKNIEGTIGVNEPKQNAGHIFQALQYLRKVCNHPCLVMTPSHPEYDSVCVQLSQQQSSLNDIQHSAKLLALKQLLLDCGIGKTEDSEIDSVVSQHRALIFCQLKSMLDIIENDLFKVHMPSVTYSRLDGSVPVNMRHSIVQRFNNDPSIDVLLLTTHVGGLGLNLTGADTVIFVEHDWNPMKDLQAMDRAHRIGQKKVVNVYRLIARGTLEEKIMGLQKFKLNIANTVITSDNSSLRSMDTSQLLDLFTVDDRAKDRKPSTMERDEKVSIKTVLEEVGDLWDESQYENEYNLNQFMASLNQ